MTDLRKFFSGKSVLLTGHTGFKGSWLSLWLATMGARVHGFSLAPPTSPNMFEEAKVAGLLASHTIGDIRNHELLDKAVRESKAEIVFHLAAQALVRASYREPRETYEINVLGTVNLLDAVRKTDSVRVCQVITSDKCYENREWVYAYRENDPMGGFDPYSSSKGCAELVVAAWRRSFFNPEEIAKHRVSVSSSRAGNVIGGGDWAADRIVPDCIRSLQKGEPILVRNPGAIRPWQHVLEPLSGYLSLAHRQWEQPADFSEAFNFGPALTSNVTVRKIVEHVIDAWGTGSWHSPAGEESSGQSRLHEANFLKLDVSKTASLLGWRPVFEVRDAVHMTVEWYRNRAHGGSEFNAQKLCVDQIRAYEKRRSDMHRETGLTEV